MHNDKTKLLKVNEDTDIFTTPNKRSNEIHVRKKVSSVHWSVYDKGVVNVRIHKFHHKETIELDITETNLESEHEKRVIFNLKADDVQALKNALNNL